MSRWPNAFRPCRTSGMDWIRRSTRMAIYHRDGFACIACGATEGLSLDHVSGDSHAPTNLVTLCSACNSSKGDLDFDEWDAEVFMHVALQTQTPINRAEGIRLAKEKWPALYAKEKARNVKRRQKSCAT